jgi:hypothetical protein
MNVIELRRTGRRKGAARVVGARPGDVHECSDG